MAKWFLKKGKNDGKGFGILWESELRQQQLLPLLETFSLSARVRPQPIPASAELLGLGRGRGPCWRQGRQLFSPHQPNSPFEQQVATGLRPLRAHRHLLGLGCTCV